MRPDGSRRFQSGLAVLAPFSVPVLLGSVLLNLSMAYNMAVALLPAGLLALVAAAFAPGTRTGAAGRRRTGIDMRAVALAGIGVTMLSAVFAGVTTPTESLALGCAGIVGASFPSEDNRGGKRQGEAADV